MAIKSKPKKSIKGRLYAYVFIILAVTYIMTSLSYSVLSRRFIINETHDDLQRIAHILEKNLIEAIERSDTNLTARTRLVKLISDVEAFDEFMKTETVVVSRQDEVLYPFKGWDQARLSKIKEDSNNNRAFIYYEYTVQEDSLPIKKIVLIKHYEDLTILRQVGLRAFIISFGIGLILTLILGTIFSKKMYKPIAVLNKAIYQYSQDKEPIKVYPSEDEIQALAEVFRDMTQSLNEMDLRQKQFFQNSSHELKTPLMSIQGYAEAIKDGVVKEGAVEESLDVIISESQRLKNIVDDVIYLSKVDNMKEAIEKKDHLLRDLIEDAHEVIKPLLLPNHLKLEINCDENIVFPCDYDKMKRIFINLISNACRYAKSKVVVNVVKKDQIFIDVIDDGPGFEPGQEKLIFDRFYHGKKGGSGIGLSLTKELVEKHGGQIYAVNNMNYGAIFKMTF